jgi:hypothetical protein
MNERSAFDLRAEEIEPEEPPGIGGFRRPDAKDKPAKLPEQTERPVLLGPGRFLGGGLLRLYRGFRLHGNQGYTLKKQEGSHG